MKGIELMLKGFGVDPEQIKRQATALYETIMDVKARVELLEQNNQRLIVLETRIRELERLMDIDNDQMIYGQLNGLPITQIMRLQGGRIEENV